MDQYLHKQALPEESRWEYIRKKMESVVVGIAVEQIKKNTLFGIIFTTFHRIPRCMVK